MKILKQPGNSTSDRMDPPSSITFQLTKNFRAGNESMLFRRHRSTTGGRFASKSGTSSPRSEAGWAKPQKIVRWEGRSAQCSAWNILEPFRLTVENTLD
jgi:hypothetical protein